MRVKIKEWKVMENACVYVDNDNLHLVDDNIFIKSMEDNLPKSRWIDVDDLGIWKVQNSKYYISEEMIEYNSGIEREAIEKFLSKI